MTNQLALPPHAAASLRRSRNIIVMLLIFFFLDVCTTIVGLSFGFHELNPFMSSMLSWMGLHGLWVSKLFALVLAAYFLYSGRLTLLRRVTVAMGMVVSWNLFWLLTHHH